MKITSDHWLAEARRELISGGSVMPVRRFLVMHYTAGATALSSIQFWRTPAARGASAHVVIDRDGTVFQCRPFDRTCGHAGVSKWTDPNTGKVYTGLNACSIGIEFANGGDSPSLIQRYSQMPPVKAVHKNGGPVKVWEAYTHEQLAIGQVIARAVVERYNLDDLIGHEDIAPDRKCDPGPAFPMAFFRKACGFTAAIRS